MSEISLDQARAIVSAAIRHAAERGVAGATAVVTDRGGFIRAAERADAAPGFGVDIAVAKARTALGFGRSTAALAAAFGDKPSLVTGLNAAVGSVFLPVGGGVIVLDAQGEPLGAAAATGGAPDVDHAAITAALADAGIAFAG
ncbi:MAG: GlcG protein [Bradyrhizobium sp.]|nr:GlcG protein [Bradyrhizobium sp.]